MLVSTSRFLVSDSRPLSAITGRIAASVGMNYWPGHMPKQLLDYSEMAAELSVPERRLRYWVTKGIVPCLRIGHRTVFFQPSKVFAALEKFEVKEVRR
jgi:hypothetical protein